MADHGRLARAPPPLDCRLGGVVRRRHAMEPPVVHTSTGQPTRPRAMRSLAAIPADSIHKIGYTAWFSDQS